MVKILQIITLSEWGGAQRVCYDLVTNLDRNKFSVEVACKPGGVLVEKLRDKGIQVHEISSFERGISLVNDLKTLFILYGLIRKNKYDIVHCHSTKAGFLARVAAKLAGVKKIYFTAHGWGFYNIEEYGWAYELLIFLEKIAAKCSTKVISVSEKTEEDGIKRKIAKRDRFLVIRNGIDWAVKQNREEARRKLGISDKEIVFGMIGRLAYPKDPLVFLRAAKNIIKNHPSAKFILIGDGPLFQKCQDFVKENNLESHLFLLGQRDPNQTQELLLGFDIFVLISKFEGLPITIIEAMFAGLPVIASNVGGIKELVKDGENGFLLNSDNSHELIEKMEYLIENPLKRKKMGERSLKIAKENFTLDKMVKSYQKLYEEMF